MALLEKIRVKFGLVISIIIALALLSFIIDPSTLESALNSMSSKYDVGKVAGKKVSYTDFQETVDKYTTINELLQGSSAQNEQIQQQIRNAAWQEYLDKYMFVENAKKAGITVGEEELVSLVSGSNPSPIIAQNPVFMDESGVFSPDALKSFLDAMASDETADSVSTGIMRRPPSTPSSSTRSTAPCSAPAAWRTLCSSLQTSKLLTPP